MGSTNNLERRFSEHLNGGVASTKSRLPVELVFTQKFLSEQEARGYERLLKDKRIAKEALIREIEK